MTFVDRPVYLIALRDTWFTDTPRGEGSLPAFGTREDAEARAREEAERTGVDPAMYRIVEFSHTGNVFEV